MTNSNSDMSFKEMATTYVYEIGQMERDGSICEEGASTLIGAMIMDLANKYTEDMGVDGRVDHAKLLDMFFDKYKWKEGKLDGKE